MSALRLHRLIEGPPDAPTLVLSNSLGTNLALWEPVLPALEAHVRVLRYDMRGHGRSPAPPGPYSLDELADDLLGLLDEEQVRQAHLCGISLGGLVSLLVSAKSPERVASLTVLSAPARFTSPEKYRDRARQVREEGVASVAGGVLGRWLTPSFAAANPDTVAALRVMILATPAEGYASCCEAVAGADLTSVLGSVSAATVCVAAAQDPSVAVDDVRSLASSLPNGRFVLVDEAAHLQVVERPDLIGPVILEQLRMAEKGAPSGS